MNVLISVVLLGLGVSLTSGLTCYQCVYTEIDGSDVSNEVGCADDLIHPKYLEECGRANPSSDDEREVNVYCTTWMNKRWHLNGTLESYVISRGCTTTVGIPHKVGCETSDNEDPFSIGIVYGETCLCDTDGCNNVPRP